MKLKTPKDCQGVELLGKWYPAENGIVEVPDMPHDLLEKGFSLYVEPVKKTKTEE